MKRSKTFIPTLRETPGDAVIVSHQLLFRAGFIRKLGNGLFAYLPLGLRVFRKIENIIREELNAIDSLECKPSVVLPGELWQKSRRWYTMGEELLRLRNRLGQDLVVSPTAEEGFTHILKDEVNSYRQYPLSVYQINTKYRDEIRPRYALMRSREFTMMDAYTFHTTDECLNKGYLDFEKAYLRIFERCGLSIILVKADTGAMGGAESEEFMVESDVGDDTLVLCPKCKYSANEEKAECKLEETEVKPTDEKPSEVETPDVKTIADLENFFNTSSKQFIKTLIYRVENSEVIDGNFVAVCIRGDLDVNEAKLKANLKSGNLELASNEDTERITQAAVGFAGPVGLKGVPIVADKTVMALHDAITGGLKTDVHLQHVEPNRDFKPDYIFDVRKVTDNDICIDCGAQLYTKKGTEVGHIFKLGKKYSVSMEMTYLDENGQQQNPTMGCYGIGVDRTLAAVIEEHNDENGIIWPMSLAPYHVTILPLGYEGEIKKTADKIYEELTKRGIEVILDDRDERPGVKFNDADLIGIPVRLVISEKSLPDIEIKLRAENETKIIPSDKIVQHVEDYVKAELKKFS
ncbi:MAG: proline--tRNA ligase [Treponema sp.]|nr:MAG: proline--tRNA ligase [Treponema sp.]